VLVIYSANSIYGAAMPATGMQNAINVDTVDKAMSWDSPHAANYPTRNCVFWIGTLGSGSHTIKGRFASNTAASTATVSQRTLLILILNGDEFQYVDDATTATATSSIIDDPNAQKTFTPSGSCKMLCMYNVANSGSSENKYGKLVEINIAGSDYAEVEKSPYAANYCDSVFTCYGVTRTNVSTTVKGRFANAAFYPATITIHRRQLGVLLFADSTLMDVISSATQITTTSNSLGDDTYATISRTTNDTRDVLVVAAASKYNSTTSAATGERYGIKINTNDRTNSSGSQSSQGTNYADSAATAYLEELAAAACTVQGRFSNNNATDSAVFDERYVVALWLSIPVTTKTLAYGLDVALRKLGLTTQAGFDVALKRILYAAYGFDIAVKGFKLTTPEGIDAALKRYGLTSGMGIDAALGKLGLTGQEGIDILLERFGIESAYGLDVALRLLGLTKPLGIDAVLGKLGLTDSGIDVILKKVGVNEAGIDAMLKRLDLTREEGIDVLLKRFDIPIEQGIDLLLKKIGLSEYAIDAILMRSGLTAPVSIDVATQRLRVTKGMGIDMLIGAITGRELGIDIALQKQLSESFGVEVALEKVGLTVQEGLDVVLKKIGLDPYAIDIAILRLSQAKPMGISAALAYLNMSLPYGIQLLLLSHDLQTMGIDAALMKQGVSQASIDSVLKLFNLTRGVGISAIIKRFDISLPMAVDMVLSTLLVVYYGIDVAIKRSLKGFFGIDVRIVFAPAKVLISLAIQTRGVTLELKTRNVSLEIG